MNIFTVYSFWAARGHISSRDFPFTNFLILIIPIHHYPAKPIASIHESIKNHISGHLYFRKHGLQNVSLENIPIGSVFLQSIWATLWAGSNCSLSNGNSISCRADYISRFFFLPLLSTGYKKQTLHETKCISLYWGRWRKSGEISAQGK